MSNNNRQDYEKSPPVGKKNRVSTKILNAIAKILARLFPKHPAGFDQEIGIWQSPDVNITKGVRRVPRPLINNNCKDQHLIYCAVIIPAKKCTVNGQTAALRQAYKQVLNYFQTEFKCEHRNCIKKVADIVWMGISCSQAAPNSDAGAILVRFHCEIEF
jgi:hypothetical protein